ncbi:MAG: hypothetical protein JXQ87_07300 [Bacteroidia bacterium]
MKKKLVPALIVTNLVIIALFLMSSTGILISTGTGNPDGSAMLEVKSTDKGVLIPRVDLDDISSNTSPVNGPAEGLLVYNDGGDQAEGFYYWDEDHDQWNSVVNEVKPVRYHISSSYSINTGSSRIQFNTATFDNNLTSPVTTGGSWRFTAPADGYYFVQCRMRLDPPSSSTISQLELRNHSNSGLISYLDVITPKIAATTNGDQYTSQGSELIYLNKGDAFYIQMYVNGTTTLYGNSNQSSISVSYQGN